MNTVFKLFLFFIAATVLHWAGMAVLGGEGVSLNVMLVFAAAVCAYVKPEYGYPTAFVCGLFLDFFSVKLFGHNALVFTLCAAAVYSLENRLDFDAAVPQLASMLGLGFLAAVCNMLLLKIFAGFSAWNGFWPFAGGIVLNAVLAPAVFWAVRRGLAAKIKTY